jgi:tetratricopeptide (TPR) repeat protein
LATQRPAAPGLPGIVEDCIAAADRLLDHARSHPAAAGEERLQALRQALTGLAQGSGPDTDEGPLAARVAAVEGELWSAWEAVVARLIKQQEYPAARRLLREGLEHARFPAERAAAFHGHFVETFGGETGQLTARAMRSLQEGHEADALRALQRAEKLLGALRDDALPAARRQEVERRLWWGYTRLGMRRLAAGDPGTAIEALAQAMRYDAGAERRVETRALLTRALEGLVDAAARVIREHADRGDTGAALEACDGLWERLRGATDLGLGPQEMATSVARVQALVETVGGRRP